MEKEPRDEADRSWGSVGTPTMKDLELPEALLKRFKWPKTKKKSRKKAE